MFDLLPRPAGRGEQPGASAPGCSPVDSAGQCCRIVDSTAASHGSGNAFRMPGPTRPPTWRPAPSGAPRARG